MIAVGKNRTRAWADRVQWECADVLAWRPEEKYEAIVTCLFLDCFPPDLLAMVIRHLAGAAAARAKWLVTDFALPESGPARWRARAVHAIMYAFFRIAVALPARRLTRPDALLASLGFQRTHRHEFEWGLIRSDLWQRSGDGEFEICGMADRCA
jgi:hypothetical protein